MTCGIRNGLPAVENGSILQVQKNTEIKSLKESAIINLIDKLKVYNTTACI